MDTTRLRLEGRRSLADAGVSHEAVLGRAAFDTPVRSPNRVIKAIVLQLPVRWVRNLNFGADPAGVPVDPAVFGSDRHRWAFLHTDHHLRQFGL